MTDLALVTQLPVDRSAALDTPTDLRPTGARLLSVLRACGPQPAVAAEQPERSITSILVREAGCFPEADAQHDLDDLLDRGFVRLSWHVLDEGRYELLDTPGRRGSLRLTRAGRAALERYVEPITDPEPTCWVGDEDEWA